MNAAVRIFRAMKATIEIEFSIDGETPDADTLTAAVWKMVSEAGYIGSEKVDETDKWGLEIGKTTVSISDANATVLLGRPKVEHRHIEDVKRIRKAMNQLGFDASDEDVGWAYEEYSENEMAAGWIVLDYWKSDEGAAKAAMRYLEQNDQEMRS